MLLRDKVAIVTGGTRGIGRALVCEFVRQGARVAFTYLKNDAGAQTLIDEMTSLGGEAIALKADARIYEEARRVIDEALSRFGRLDILVNNAGIVKDKALMMMDPLEWKDVIDTNLTGYFNMSRAAIVTMMKQKSGSIVNISSVAGVVGLPRQVNYSSAKAGILGMTKSLAKEVGPYNIRVNAIAPGYVETDMTRDLKDREKLVTRVPLSRFGKPEEVAKIALFIVSDRAGYITGQVVKIDGGLAM